MSKIVGGQFLLGELEREVLVKMMWRVAEFLCIDILAYTVLSNHFHQLLLAGKVDLNDAQLRDKLAQYYGERSRKVLEFDEVLAEGGEALERLREGYLKRMGDVSEFEKILKQSFSTWYNKHHKRRGTLWMERFKSILVEDTLEMRQVLSEYIDLNAVRAQIVEDPAHYRFCSYAAALGGDERCRRGIERVMGISDWEEASRCYRIELMGRGHVEVQGKKGKVSRKKLLEVLTQGGRLSRWELLRLRVRYFSDGLALGSEQFVEEIFGYYRSHFGEKRKTGSRKLYGWPDERLNVIRGLREEPIS